MQHLGLFAFAALLLKVAEPAARTCS